MNKDKYVFAQMVEFLDNNKLSYALLPHQDAKHSVKWLHYIGNEVNILHHEAIYHHSEYRMNQYFSIMVSKRL